MDPPSEAAEAALPGPRSQRRVSTAEGAAPHPSALWRTLRLVSASSLGVALLLAIEAVLVGLVHHKELAGPWELRVALLEIVPVGALAAVPLAFVAAVLSALLEEADRIAPRVLLSAFAAAAAAAVGIGVSTGPHFARVPVRVAFVALFALSAAAFVGWLARRACAARRSAPGAFAAGLAGVSMAAVAANVLVLPRLYPAFHLALATIVLVLAAWLGELALRALAPRWTVLAAVVLLAACGAGTWRASRDLAHWDNVRLLYLAHAPQLTYAVRVAALLTPSSADAPSVIADVARPTGSDRQWVDWRDRDVLLITIDALRADHLGAYGYARPTSPFIDEMARTGVQFDRAYCAMPHTSYSITSLMTGKYIRPLMLQGAGADSDTFAGLMRLYGYRTAAFYPPSLFVVDRNALSWAEDKGLDFEYRKVEYAKADYRVSQVERYLDRDGANHKLFLWVHLFEPHEPYEQHPEHDFGDRDIDHYDSEVATADRAVGRLVSLVRFRRPKTVVILAADHGEEFGDHGGFYHGTTVFEEQVRVPLIIDAEGLAPRKVAEPVQLIDILPTMLNALGVPRTPRLRGNDLGPWLVGAGKGDGSAFAESYDQVLLAQSTWRLVCERKVDACALYDLADDPSERRDRAAEFVERTTAMRRRLREIESSHGAYELAGARLEGKALPPALVRGIAGDVNAAKDVAGLLDDADVVLRRRAAEVLFDLAAKDASPALSLALTRDEDLVVRRWCTLALTRMGQGAPLAVELLNGNDLEWKRLAAFAFADAGDARGEEVLVDWWNAGGLTLDRQRDIVRAFAKIKSKAAVVPLTRSLDDPNLRPDIAAALAKIGDPYGRIALLSRFSGERYENSRRAIAQALVDLGATGEMAPALTRFLGVSDPLADGVRIAEAAQITNLMGGPDGRGLQRVHEAGPEGVSVPVVVPKGGNGTGFRFIVRARVRDDHPGNVRAGFARAGLAASATAPLARLEDDTVTTMVVAPGGWREVTGAVPSAAKLVAAHPAEVVLAPDANVEIEAFVLVPLADEIPPPPPEPWVAPSRDDASSGDR